MKTVQSLQDALDILDSAGSDMQSVVNNESLWQYINQADKVGAELMSAKSDDYVLGMATLVQIISVMVLVQNGMSITKMLYLSSDDDVSKLCSLVMKLSVGLAAMEELH